MSDKTNKNKQAVKILTYLENGNEFSYEKLVLRFMLRLPIFMFVEIIILTIMAKQSFSTSLLMASLAHLIPVCYFALRKNLHVKNKVRCDWIL